MLKAVNNKKMHGLNNASGGVCSMKLHRFNNRPAAVDYIKLLFAGAVCFLAMQLQCSAITLEEMTNPQPPAYRLGVGASPEKAYKVSDSQKAVNTKDADIDKNSEAVKNITYADLSLKKIAKEISDDASLEESEMLSDIQMLWIGAAQNSQTVKFIVYKLSNPEEDKPDESIVKKIIQPISTVGSLAGIGIGNPVAAISSIMGSSVLGSMSVNDKDLNYKFSKVNDADMVVLIRKIEELQRKIVHYYFDYMTSREALRRSDTLVYKRKKAFQESAGMSDEKVLMLDVFYREALNKQSKLRSDFLAKRSALEQLVGMETMGQFEDMLAQRESKMSKQK